MLRRHFAAIFCLCLSVLTALGLTGCGGASVALTHASAPDKTTYIAQADAICDAEAVKIGKPPALKIRLSGTAGKHESVKSNLASVAAQIAPVLTIERNTLMKVRRLAEPAGDRHELANIWDARASMIGALRRSEHLLKTHPASKRALAVQNAAAARAAVRYSHFSRSYGFKVCGRSRDAA